MDTDPLSLDSENKQSKNDEGRDLLIGLIDDYQNLLGMQSDERKDLLRKIDELSRRTNQIKTIDSRLEQFKGLLLDIRKQIFALSSTSKTTVPKPTTSVPKITATQSEIDDLAEEIEGKTSELDSEIDSLTNLLEEKKEEINQKDIMIDELNDKLELLSEEKSRLAEELEHLNEVIDAWKTQLDILQKLAASDPRYKVIAALKKHGSLTDIQLAFSMGTSINQLRKYIEDLIALQLVRKSTAGRYEWTGQELEDQEF